MICWMDVMQLSDNFTIKSSSIKTLCPLGVQARIWHIMTSEMVVEKISFLSCTSGLRVGEDSVVNRFVLNHYQASIVFSFPLHISDRYLMVT